MANISDVLSDTVDVIFDENKVCKVYMQPQSITTLVVTPKSDSQYKAIDFNHIDIYQKGYSSYDLDVSLKESENDIEFYVSNKKDSFEEIEKVTYTKSGSKYTFNIDVEPGDFYLNSRTASKSTSLLLTIPRMTPKIQAIEDEDSYYVNTFFGLSGETSWSSFCDPEGKNVYKSKKPYFDEEAVHVNVNNDGSVDPIQILDGNYSDLKASKDYNYYYVVMNGKNGLTTFYSSSITFRESIIDETSIAISFDIVDAVPYLVFEGDYLQSDYEQAKLILKDNAYERHASINLGDSHLSMKLDLRQMTTLGKWYDIMLERGNGISLDMYEENCLDMDQKITANGITYEFKEYDGYLKVNSVVL